jgi:hypothetical protein
MEKYVGCICHFVDIAGRKEHSPTIRQLATHHSGPGFA